MKKICILLFVCVSIVLIDAQIYEKSLAGPPEEFKNHRIPNPENFSRIDDSVLETILFDGSPIVEYIIPVDTEQNFTFSLSSPYIDDLNVSLISPLGEIINPIFERTNFTWGVGNSAPMFSSTIENNIMGNYTLKFLLKNRSNIPFELILIWFNNDDLTVRTFLSSYIIAKGKKIDIIADIDLEDESMSFHEVDVTSAFIEIFDMNGNSIMIPMEEEDETDNNDDEGIWRGTVPLRLSGSFIMSPTICGTYEPTDELKKSTFERTGVLLEEISFMRTSRHLIVISDADVTIGDKSKIIEKDCDIYYLIIPVKNRGNITRFRYYTELWGIDECGDEFPIVWLGGLTNITNNILKIQLNKKWLCGIDSCDDLILKNTYVADVNTSFPVDNQTSNIQVYWNYEVFNHIKANKNNKVNITKEMREGINPFKLMNKRDINQIRTGIIMLPGYCSSTNPWLSSRNIFSKAFYFDENNLNLSNDAYARRVINFIINKTPIRAMSYIAHSQGGMVSTHLLNYYFTDDDDRAGNGRLVQSVGTPYQGTSLADDVASFTRIFGIGCGGNSDLSRDGAANWISGISTFQRREIYFYTTTYLNKAGFPRFCNLGTNLLLSNPNDGITELSSSMLPNGNNEGNTVKQCHSVSMEYLAQYDDRERNIEMNRLAAKSNP